MTMQVFRTTRGRETEISEAFHNAVLVNTVRMIFSDEEPGPGTRTKWTRVPRWAKISHRTHALIT